MQRIEALIEKLRTQFNNKADLSQLLITTQMIQREISGEMRETAVLGSSSVAVVMPNMPSVNKGIIIKDKQGNEREYFQLDISGEDEADEEELRLLELQHEAGMYTAAPEPSSAKSSGKGDKRMKIQEFDPLIEVPTLFQQVRNGDLLVAADNNIAITVEPEHGAAAVPVSRISDLTVDVSDTDRERFVKNLFRGDAVMYNRSIKTINNFDTLEEAEYWVKRELKTKLGWANNRDVEYFDRLIYRRFSQI
ncbi:hypothetical protein [Niabella drilacis]|uniref:Uncharacterized protein n=1 Tax=Niabella drilacis (strain DSM 25811 / CCM 8410 / CCUG 62505 / LMG 26954 / E90) TaxID=1285928 RepID=A0A1G6V237_NIADE|nr:hypothetical protein [Niabella drilacis]SDD46935.1 hypothetical protein SAMN04487894_109146 [Niabella drilacis]